jgi:chromosome segregation ATPase
MRVPALAVLVLVLFPAVASGQTTSADSRTLQAILEEIHKLRQELQMTSATVQRAQILLYRMRAQLDVVNRATDRLEQAKTELNEKKTHRAELAGFVKQHQELLEQTRDPEGRKGIEMQLSILKNQLEQQAAEEPEAEAKEAECSNQLRNEQAKLEELQNQLDRLDSQLADFPQHKADAQ